MCIVAIQFLSCSSLVCAILIFLGYSFPIGSLGLKIAQHGYDGFCGNRVPHIGTGLLFNVQLEVKAGTNAGVLALNRDRDSASTTTTVFY